MISVTNFSKIVGSVTVGAVVSTGLDSAVVCTEAMKGRMRIRPIKHLKRSVIQANKNIQLHSPRHRKYFVKSKNSSKFKAQINIESIQRETKAHDAAILAQEARNKKFRARRPITMKSREVFYQGQQTPKSTAPSTPKY